MGYSTEFKGAFLLDQPLFDTQVLYLLEFSRTRRVKRNVDRLQNIPDPARASVGLPLGEEGGYFVNGHHADAEDSIIQYNLPPKGQPGLWCQWIPTANGNGIEWDQGEKFYKYVEWLQYLIENFIAPWGYQLNGTVKRQGEDGFDRGVITVEANQITVPADAAALLHKAVSPVVVGDRIWQGFKAVAVEGEAHAMSYVSVVNRAIALGYPETADWIRANILEYGAGTERGFASESTSEMVILLGYPTGL